MLYVQQLIGSTLVVCNFSILYWGKPSVAYLICGRWAHEWNSVILPPQKSPKCLKAALWLNKKYQYVAQLGFFFHSSQAKASKMIEWNFQEDLDTLKIRKGRRQKDGYGLNCNRKWLTLIGVYHLDSGWWCVGGYVGAVGFLIMGSSASSCIDITAFLAFSSRAPSSVDPFSPQRTYTDIWKKEKKRHYIIKRY